MTTARDTVRTAIFHQEAAILIVYCLRCGLRYFKNLDGTPNCICAWEALWLREDILTNVPIGSALTTQEYKLFTDKCRDCGNHIELDNNDWALITWPKPSTRRFVCIYHDNHQPAEGAVVVQEEQIT